MSRARAAMQKVELQEVELLDDELLDEQVESDVGGADAGGSDAGGAAAGGADVGGAAVGAAAAGIADAGVGEPAPRIPSRRRWPVLAALVFAFALPAGAQSWLDPAPSSDLIGVPGVLDPLDGPVEPLWTSTRAAADLRFEVGGVLVGSSNAGSMTGIATARGIDAATGTELWSVPLEQHPGSSAHCEVTGGPAAGTHRAVLICMVIDADTPREAYGTTFFEPTRAHLAVLEPATGRVLRTLPADPYDSLASIQADVVVAVPAEPGIVVSRIDPRTGREVWSDVHETEPGQTPPLNAVVQRLGSTVYVSAGSQTWTLSANGRPGREWDEPQANGGWSTQRHAGGHVLRWVNGPDGKSVGTDLQTGATITAPAGEGPAWGVDDGSVPGLLLMRGIGLIARDLATGDVLWRAPGPVDSTLVLDGVVYSVGPGAVRAQDGVTGAELWTTTTDPVAAGSLVTDGTSLIVPGPAVSSAAGSGSPDDPASLVALDPRDGSVRWTVGVPTPIQAVVAAAGHLLVQSADGTFTAFS